MVTSPDQPAPERTEATSTWKVDPFPTPSKLASTVKTSPTVYPVPWSTIVNPVTVPPLTTKSAVAEAPVLGTRAVTVKPAPASPVTPRTSPTAYPVPGFVIATAVIDPDTTVISASALDPDPAVKAVA